jgi:hypothetical protein
MGREVGGGADERFAEMLMAGQPWIKTGAGSILRAFFVGLEDGGEGLVTEETA